MAFGDILGHDRVLARLVRAIAAESLPPSLIFDGPAGVGKCLAAIAVAQALNCSRRRGEPPAIDACGACPSCTRIARGLHADVLVLSPGESGSIKVDEVREIIDRSSYRPFEGRRRVVVVDSAEALVPQAQNALLKILEEPPAATVFILVTAQPDRLLPTVRSRCPRLRFGPLEPDVIARALMARGQSETRARALAAAAGGSLGRALEMTADAAAARQVAEQALRRAAATDDPRRRLEGAKDLLAGTGAGGVSDRARLALHLRAMASLLRDAELVGAGSAGALANPDLRPAVEQLARAYAGERGLRAFGAVDEALAALDRNAGVKIVADWVMLRV